MAGAKGKSGGKRPGAGRPKKPPEETIVDENGVEREPLDFLRAVYNGRIEATTVQVRAAVAAAQYVHAKKGEGGKKESDADAAAKIASAGKFAPASSPRLN
jgi:phage terminase small subunit